jgi:hypothetical protein
MPRFPALALCAVAIATACVSTRFDDGQLLCRPSDAEPCPAGLTCAHDGKCHTPEVAATLAGVGGGAATTSTGPGAGGAGGSLPCQPKECGASGLCGMDLDDGCGHTLSCICRDGVSCLNNACSCPGDANEHPAGKGTDFAVNAVAWTNPDNILANDDNRAIATLAPGQKTHRLVAQSFKLTPGAAPGTAGVFIDAVHVFVYRSGSGTGSVHDAAVRLLDEQGALLASEKAVTTTWPTTDGKREYVWKVPTDVKLGADQVRSANFGVMVEATNTSKSSASARVDFITLKLDFHCDLTSSTP